MNKEQFEKFTGNLLEHSGIQGREIGKRKYMQGARALAEELAVMTSRGARWIGKDALREFDTAHLKRHLA